MRILVYGINYAPELTGIGKYTGEMCEWLAGRGHEVKVVTAPPYYPAWTVAEGYSASRYSQENLNGLTVLRCPLWVPARQSGLRRILHLLSFAISSSPVVVWTALAWRPQIVFVLEPTFLCTPAALLAARLSGAKAWLHIQDLELDAAYALGLIRSRILKGAALLVEHFMMRLFDRVSTISNSMLACIRSKGVTASKSLLFPNWVDTKSIHPQPVRSILRAEWGIADDAIVALYSGNMGEKQGLEIIVEAARILATDRKILFMLCGDGVARQRLIDAAKGLETIRFVPLQPAERLNDLLNLADIHILPQRSDVASLVMPSKLLGMLASGRPIVAAASLGSELASLAGRCGIVVEPDDAMALAGAVRGLAHDPGKRLLLGAAAREMCLETWDVGHVLMDFEMHLTAVCSKRYKAC